MGLTPGLLPSPLYPSNLRSPVLRGASKGPVVDGLARPGSAPPHSKAPVGLLCLGSGRRKGRALKCWKNSKADLRHIIIHIIDTQITERPCHPNLNPCTVCSGRRVRPGCPRGDWDFRRYEVQSPDPKPHALSTQNPTSPPHRKPSIPSLDLGGNRGGHNDPKFLDFRGLMCTYPCHSRVY